MGPYGPKNFQNDIVQLKNEFLGSIFLQIILQGRLYAKPPETQFFWKCQLARF